MLLGTGRNFRGPADGQDGRDAKVCRHTQHLVELFLGLANLSLDPATGVAQRHRRQKHVLNGGGGILQVVVSPLRGFGLDELHDGRRRTADGFADRATRCS